MMSEQLFDARLKHIEEQYAGEARGAEGEASHAAGAGAGRG
jgi:hypothetical protein